MKSKKVKNKFRWKKINCIKCKKYRTFKNPEIVYLFYKTVVSVICGKCHSECTKIFKEEESLEILRILGLIKIIQFFKNMEK